MEVQQANQEAQAAFAATLGAEVQTPAPAGAATPAPTSDELAQIVEDERIAGFTPDQIKTLLAQAAMVGDIQKDIRRLDGRYGELNSKLTERAVTPTPAPAVPATPIDPNFETEYADFANYAKSASRQAADAAFAKLQGASPETISKATDAVREEMELRFLTFQHKDWKDVLQQPEYQTWLALQSPEVQETARTTPDALELGGVISQFKDSRKTVADSQQRRTTRLEQGLAPTGVAPQAPPVQTDQDIARNAFNAIRKPK